MICPAFDCLHSEGSSESPVRFDVEWIFLDIFKFWVALKWCDDCNMLIANLCSKPALAGNLCQFQELI